MVTDAETYYDEFSSKFIHDLVVGNERIEQQLVFLSRALPSTIQTVLIVGCGAGQSAHHVATKIARHSKVLAVDLSQKSLQMASGLFRHPRIEYRKLDIMVDPLEGRWDAIVFPDVYEHIPKAGRPMLHERLNQLLTPAGRVLFTVPSPGKQASLEAKGEGLQIIDEVVTLEDLTRAASDVGGVLTYFNMVSVWETNDYIHAIVERGADRVGPIGPHDMIALKGLRQENVWTRGIAFTANRLKISKLRQTMMRRRIGAILRQDTSIG